MEAFDLVRGFECKIAEKTGAPYVVAVNSCSAALLLAFSLYKKRGGDTIELPKRTYPSVPMAARQAGLTIAWKDSTWSGVYRAHPSNIWDCAKRLRRNMYAAGETQCVSFHARKLLPIGCGGAILHDDPQADAWYRRMRFDFRTEGVLTAQDSYLEPGHHCYMLPEQAGRGLHLLLSYDWDQKDQPMDDYPDMSLWEPLWA